MFRLVVAFAALAPLTGWLVARGASHHAVRPEAAAVGAYETGGMPELDPALDELLGERLALLAVATDDARHGRTNGEANRRRIDAELRDAPAIAQRGPYLLAAWHAFLDALATWEDSPVGSHGYHDADHALRTRAHELTDRFAALGLAYYVDAATRVDHGRAHAFTLVYVVEQVSFVRYGDQRRRVLELRRLDRLDAERHLLGMQSEQLGDPVVLIDQIEDFVQERIAPVLGGDPYELGQAPMRLQQAAGDAVRAELAWRGAVVPLVVATVRRHEGRHAIDIATGEPVQCPEPLAALVGTKNDAFAIRARAELAAYLTQIASDPITPQLALWNLASQAFHSDRWGSPESYVAVVVLDGLARRTGAPLHLPPVRFGKLDRAELANLALPLAHLSDGDLRAAARNLWTDLYGEPLISVD